MTAKILLVDDVEGSRKLLEAKLTAEYYQVSTAADGATALELAARQPIDILITDLRLPGAGGLEVARAARRACVGRILLISAFVLPEAAAAVDAVLAKPFANERVLEWLAGRGEPR